MSDRSTFISASRNSVPERDGLVYDLELRLETMRADNERLRDLLGAISVASDSGHWYEPALVGFDTAWHLTVTEYEWWEALMEQAGLAAKEQSTNEKTATAGGEEQSEL